VLDEPWVSAVVEIIRPPIQTLSDGTVADHTMRITSMVKQHFTTSGFEVHAPFASSFSIAAKESVFEKFFGQKLVIDQEQLLGTVTTEAGGLELPMDMLPDDVAPHVKSISFIPPPSFG